MTATIKGSDLTQAGWRNPAEARMPAKIIDWHIERAAQELTKAKVGDGFAQDLVERYQYQAGMHLASANAPIESRIQIGPLDV